MEFTILFKSSLSYKELSPIDDSINNDSSKSWDIDNSQTTSYFTIASFSQNKFLEIGKI